MKLPAVTPISQEIYHKSFIIHLIANKNDYSLSVNLNINLNNVIRISRNFDRYPAKYIVLINANVVLQY